MIEHPTGWRYTMTDECIEASEKHDTLTYHLQTGELIYDCLVLGKMSKTLQPFLSIDQVFAEAEKTKESCAASVESEYQEFVEEQAFIDQQNRD